MLRNYHTLEPLNYPFMEGLELFKKCVESATEDRMYMFWVAYATNPFGGKKRMSWDEFRKGGKENPKEADTNSNYKGVDLVKRMKNKG